MKRLTGKKVFTTLKSVSYHFINSSDDAFRCVPYHKSSCENLLRIHYGFTYMSKRTLRKNASKIAVKDFSDKQPFDSLEQFEQTSEFKSSRLPPKVPLKNTQQLFTVSNVQSEEIEREANSESEPQETKALSLARKIRKENAKAKNPFAEKVIICYFFKYPILCVRGGLSMEIAVVQPPKNSFVFSVIGIATKICKRNLLSHSICSF